MYITILPLFNEPTMVTIHNISFFLLIGKC